MGKSKPETASNKKESTLRMVVMAASAGGIDALCRVLPELPADLPAAMAVVQHLRGDRITNLPAFLDRLCPMRVCLVEEGMPVEEGLIVVAQPGKHLGIKDFQYVTNILEKVNYVRPSADVLFSSAAEVFGPRVIGVILSGTGRDGANGCINIKSKGGTIIAQDKRTAKYFGMPRAAMAADAVDYVLPIEKIGTKIIELIYASPSQKGGQS